MWKWWAERESQLRRRRRVRLAALGSVCVTVVRTQNSTTWIIQPSQSRDGDERARPYTHMSLSRAIPLALVSLWQKGRCETLACITRTLQSPWSSPRPPSGVTWPSRPFRQAWGSP